jgi:hypothetical protein
MKTCEKRKNIYKKFKIEEPTPKHNNAQLATLKIHCMK